MTEPIAVDRRTGAAAVTGSALMFASVAASSVWSTQTPDGSVTNSAGLVLLVGAWTVGAAALAVALIGLGRGSLPRPGPVGAWLSAVGAALLSAFGVVLVVTALASGAPAFAAYLVDAAGFLLLGIGAVPLALGLRRSGALGGWWIAVLVAGACALAAPLTPVNPWHAVELFVLEAAWFAVGLRLLAAPRRTVVPA